MIDTPVLIVGAGPVGLAMGLLLAQQGVACRIVERRPRRLGAPKAHAINPRTLEICRALGIPREAFAARATDPAESRMVRFMTRLGGRELGALPYERQGVGALDHTPTPLLNIAQPDFEDVLAERIAAEPLITLERGVRWTSATQDGSTVLSATDADPITSRWLIGADGAESAVRKALGIAMIGPAKLQHRLMIHFRADLRALLIGRAAAIYWNMDPRSPGGFIAFDMGANWVFMYRYDPDATDPSVFSTADCEALVRAAIDGEVGEVEILHRSPWALSVQLAERYAQGRILLIGDAAHRFPPTGGLGLNTGVQDAHNIAWKIAAIQQGGATDALIDSYEKERRPVADVNAAQSHANARELTRLFGYVEEVDARFGTLDAALDNAQVRAEIAALLDAQREHFDSFGLQLGFRYGDRDWAEHVGDYRPSIATGARMPHAWVVRGGMRISTLDLLARDRFTVIAGRDWRHDCGAAIAIAREGEAFHDPDGHWVSVAGLAADEALLVRPDGHVLARGTDIDDLRTAMAALLNPGSR